MTEKTDGKKNIHLSISPEIKQWIKENSWFNASGFFESTVRKLRKSLEEKEFYKPLR